MSFPAEGVESAIKNNIEDVRVFLDSKHPGHYAVYNLSTRTYRSSKFHNRVGSPDVCLSLHALFFQSALRPTWAFPRSGGGSRQSPGSGGGRLGCGDAGPPGSRRWGQAFSGRL